MNLPPNNLNFVGRLTWKNEVFFDFFWFPPDFWTKTHIKMDSPLGGYQLKYGLLPLISKRVGIWAMTHKGTMDLWVIIVYHSRFGGLPFRGS